MDRIIRDNVPISGAGVNAIPEPNSFPRQEFRIQTPTWSGSSGSGIAQAAARAGGWLEGNARASTRKCTLWPGNDPGCDTPVAANIGEPPAGVNPNRTNAVPPGPLA